ncbi:hypothetical protein EXIGLDRAFT_837115 [Exidia glandulosa HHB12029]|uniref:F-box domain-containing protein n=1 Tax=Exidia glandulosa HHB12029 TaxID=1314781 RepID=A0A165H2Y4_EXIGL|nr:hypothetical protein EXIGLDRAFT_837115 [Exidia glandulosa HHB12029]
MQTRHPAWLPPELLGEVGSFLPCSALYRAVCVSRYWRATLLASPRLWDDIFVFLNDKRKDRWTDVLELLFARNAGRPLSLKLGWWELNSPRKDWVALHSVCALVALHMPHIKSLSFDIPYRHDMLLLRTPAPILETLEVDNSSGEGILEMLPVDLFAGIAPRLRSVHLREVELPPRCPALRTVTKLVLDSYFALRVSHLPSLLVHLPLLDELNVSAGDGYDFHESIAGEPPSELAIDLHLAFGPGLEFMLALFPRARAISYDFNINEDADEPDPADVDAAIERAIRTVPSPKSMHIRWEPTISRFPVLAVVLDGRKVIERAELSTLRPTLSVALVTSIVQSVTNLTVPEELWPVFERCPLRPSLDVTIIVSQAVPRGYTRDPGCTPKLHLTAPSVKKSIRTLALARPYDCLYGGPQWILSASLLQEFVANAVTPGSLQSVVLHGIVLDGPATFDRVDLAALTVADMMSPEVDADRRRDELEDWALIL